MNTNINASKTIFATLFRRFGAYVAIAILGSLVVAHLSGFASATPRITAVSAVAGYGTTLLVTDMDPYQPLLYTLDNPAGQRFTFQGFTDANGSTEYHVNEAYLQTAGVYRVMAQETQGSLVTKTIMFTVYPDQTSPQASQFQISKQQVQTGSYDFALAKVRVVDTYGNPLSQHFIQIISNRPADLIKPYVTNQYTTDDRGEVTYALTSPQIGVSSYTAYDLTAQQTVGAPLMVQYGATASLPAPVPTTFNASTSASLFQTNVLGVGGDQDAGPAYNFTFEQMPASVKVNQPVDFTVTAYDIAQKMATSYIGTVHFSAVGDNSMYVNFPQDYTFTPSDLGKHTFPLSLLFQQEGTYQLQVQDTKKPTLSGITTVVVKGGSTTSTTGSNLVAITVPSPGSYSANIQTISGNAPAGKDVKIYDNNEEIGTVVANLKSQFEYTTQPLADGSHEFAALSVDQKGVVIGSSDKVSITINTKPPALQGVQLVPGFSATPGLSVQIQVMSDAHLKSLTLDMNGTQTELTEDVLQPGVYRGTFASPVQPGQYDLKFVIHDALNNQNSVVYEQKLIVTPDAAQSLKAVKDVKAVPGLFKVSLMWSDPDNSPTLVKNYRIFYGTSPTTLTNSVDTLGNAHQWYVPNLQNGVAYYFGVVAVDQSGNYGAGGTLIFATPNDPQTIKGGLPAADTLIGSDTMNGETGPEVLWLVPLSIIGYQATRKLRSKAARKGSRPGRQ